MRLGQTGAFYTVSVQSLQRLEVCGLSTVKTPDRECLLQQDDLAAKAKGLVSRPNCSAFRVGLNRC